MMFAQLRLATSVFACAVLVRSAVLVNFQVAAPPNVPKGVKTCEVTVVDYEFASSYYSPSLFDYTPPAACGAPGSWAAVTLNLTVTSNGTQYDRLAIMTLGNTEIWRTSTAEPTRDGIIWTYTKDVTRYIPVFAKSGVFNMELNNVYDSRYTGAFTTTVVATFYSASGKTAPAPKSNLIIPIGTKDSTSTGAEVSVPPTYSESVTFPRNAIAAYAEIYASGNGQEEFWYFNAPNAILPSLPAGITYGTGSFREVRLSVDGRLAGVVFPYATFFTGAIVPTAWRPIPGFGAFDLPTYHVDLTPFIPLLVDGKAHNISLDVASGEADHAINPNWYLSANIQVITDSSNKPTTGKILSYSAPAYATSTLTNNTAANGDVSFTLGAKHSVQITSTITSGSGKTNFVIWSQNMQFSNTQNYLDGAARQVVKQTATGTILSLHNGLPAVTDSFEYPLSIDYQALNAAGSSWNATFDQGYQRTVLPAPFILGSTTKEHQVADGAFYTASTGNTGVGSSNSTISYLDTKGGTYYRSVGAYPNNITHDSETGSLARGGFWGFPWSASKGKGMTSLGEARLPGRVSRHRG